MQHTPGPWKVTQDDEWPFSIRVHAADGGIISLYKLSYSTAQDTAAECMAGFVMPRQKEAAAHNRQQLANATLHAAAPDLLAALRKAFTALELVVYKAPEFGVDDAYHAVSDAIAKAANLTEG